METNKTASRSEDELFIRKYLLGLLPDVEAEALEQRSLEDAALFEEMQEIEDELIDDYAKGVLTEQDRTRFEEYFLRSPERREKVQFSITITEHAVAWKNQIQAGAPQPAFGMKHPTAHQVQEQNQGNVVPLRGLLRPVAVTPWRQWLAIAAAVLIAVSAGALWVKNRELRQDLMKAKAEESRLQRQADSATERASQAETEAAAEKKRREEEATILVAQMHESEKLQPPGTVSESLGLANLARTTRSGNVGKAKTIKVPSTTSAMRLNVQFEATRFQSFTAVLQRGEGNIVKFSSGTLEAREIGTNQRLALKIPARNLSVGAYQLIIKSPQSEGEVEVARYLLNIVR